MPDKKISELPAGLDATGVEVLPIVQSGVTVKLNVANLIQFERDRVDAALTDLGVRIDNIDPTFPGPIDADVVTYNTTSFAGVALDQLFSENIDLDDTGHRVTTWTSSVDPITLGAAPTVNDRWHDPVTGASWTWRTTPTATGLGDPWTQLSGAWITSGIVGEPFIDASIARVSYVDASVADVLGGLTPEDIAALADLADALAGSDIATELAGKVPIAAAAGGELYRRGLIGAEGLSIGGLAVHPAFVAEYAPLSSATILPFRNETTSVTLNMGDAGGAVRVNNAGPFVADVSVPTNANVAFPEGTFVEVHRTGAGGVHIVAQAGVALASENNMFTIAATMTAIRLLKTSPNGWMITGALA